MMEIKIVVPALGESVVEATVARWLKNQGDSVAVGETLVELETDKVNLEVGAEKAGVLARIERQSGQDVKIGDVLGVIADAPPQTPVLVEKVSDVALTSETSRAAAKATPSARRLAQENHVDLEQIEGTGSGNQITRQDVESYLQKKKPVEKPKSAPAAAQTVPPVVVASGDRREERVRMSRRRRTIAARLLEAQHNAAILTTYNEVDMSPVMEIRKRQKDSFKQRHGVGLGIVSFFTKAVLGALREFPALNAEIQGEEVVFKRYYDIGIAIGAEEGLVVPVLRDADQMSFAQIEKGIRDYVEKSQSGTLSLEDLRGGTFTITNGGVFGSLLSTPILNPPQVAILGLHKIEDRPVVAEGQIVIRSMMYIALSYDHRIVDGRESVQFLARVKQLIEDPSALLLEG